MCILNSGLCYAPEEQEDERIDLSPQLQVGLLVLLSGTLTFGSPAFAEEDEEDTEEISVIGTRSHDRSSTDLAVPVDVLDSNELLDQGDSRTESMLARVVPSLNVDGQPISDAATIVRPFNLRGLPSDSTLVLVNGKRRHRSSVITFIGWGLNDGAHGADIASIPAIALDRVEILRDGAAAQYGSDAVAGILNFVLKEDSEGGQLQARYGQYYYGDGENVTIAGNMGLPLGDSGFLNLSGEYNTSKPTSRSVQRGDAAALIAAGNEHVRSPAAQIWGAPDIDDNFKLFANAGIEVSESFELYAFGNYAERTVDGGFFFRNPIDREGIFGPVTLADESKGLIVVDHTPGDMMDCPDVPIDAEVMRGNVPSSVSGGGDCYVFNARFPGGFTPQFGGDVEDHSIAVGFRGELMDGGLTYDFSAVYGEHETDFFIYNTINPQLAAMENNIQTSYDPGLYREKDYTINLDFTTEWDVGAFASPVHVGFGFEHRNEEFEIEAGELNSYYIARYDSNGDGMVDSKDALKYPYLGIGTNGFSGFRPDSAGSWDRDSNAAYIDFEVDVPENLLFGVAFRHEDPEDFDSTLDGKVSARVQATDTLAFRGSFGTGFRVPTTGQSNVRNVTTELDAEGKLADTLTVGPRDPLLQGVASPLDHEESESFGVGAVFNVGALDVTIDYFHIEIDDRIALTTERPLDCLLLEKAHGGECYGNGSAGYVMNMDDANYGNRYDNPNFNANQVADEVARLRADLEQSVPDQSSVNEVRWFANDFDTTTEGIDIVATYPMDLFDGSTDLTFAANWTRTEITKRNPDTIADHTVLQKEEAVPKTRFSLTADHQKGPWRVLGRFRYYGDYVNVHLNVPQLTQRLDKRFLFDMQVTYTCNDNYHFTVGAENLFDVDPDKSVFAGIVGAEYPENSPFDFNGGFYYAKAVFEF